MRKEPSALRLHQAPVSTYSGSEEGDTACQRLEGGIRIIFVSARHDKEIHGPIPFGQRIMLHVGFNVRDSLLECALSATGEVLPALPQIRSPVIWPAE